jgi:hypothetical protein
MDCVLLFLLTARSAKAVEGGFGRAAGPADHGQSVMLGKGDGYPHVFDRFQEIFHGILQGWNLEVFNCGNSNAHAMI